MNTNDSQTSNNPKKPRIIKPVFSIDDSKRVICESHSQIERIRALSSLSDISTFFETQQLEHILSCKTCKHYQDDVCYFPKSEIDKIEHDRLSYTFHCNLCGGSIDRPMTIMYSLYNKNKFNVNIPTVCCTCFSSLEDDTFLSKTRKRIGLLGFSFVINFLTVLYFIFRIASNIWWIILLCAGLGVWALLAIPDIRNIIFLLRGQKYYKKTYGKVKEKKKGEYVGDFPFD